MPAARLVRYSVMAPQVGAPSPRLPLLSVAARCPILGARREPILVAAASMRGKEAVQGTNCGVRAEPRPVAERVVPALLECGGQVGSHGVTNVAVDAAHPGYLVAHPFGAQEVGDAIFLHPGLVTVAQTMRCQPGEDRQPGGERGVIGGRLTGVVTPSAVGVVVGDQEPVRSAGLRPSATWAASCPGVAG